MYLDKMIEDLRKRGKLNLDDDVFIELSKIVNLNELPDSLLKALKDLYPERSLKYLITHPNFTKVKKLKS